MAWWNQPEGSVTPTVTLRRLAAWLAVRGHRYDLDPVSYTHLTLPTIYSV